MISLLRGAVFEGLSAFLLGRRMNKSPIEGSMFRCLISSKDKEVFLKSVPVFVLNTINVIDLSVSVCLRV